MLSIWLVQPFLLLKASASQTRLISPIIIDTLAAMCVTVSLLRMPLRDPSLVSSNIGSQSYPPSSDLRSPEDDLTIWQFMTVSWMSPLIGVGSKRQLNEEDIWSLGHQFQHRLLHDRFADLKGSVTRRLLAANGLDLVITSSLAVLESAASRYINRLCNCPTSQKHS